MAAPGPARRGAPLRADIAIVGAGITGLSIAFHLAERGAGRIVVYEREGIGAGASGVQPGGLRQQWGTRLNCLMARDSLAFYRQLPERLESGLDPGWEPCGYLFLADTPGTLERLGSEVALQNDLGIPSRLVEPDEAAELVPGLRTESTLGGSWCAEDGYFDRPQSVIEAFAEAARRLGAAVEKGEVTALEPLRAGWRLRLRDGSAVETGAVVVAAGVHTTALVPLPIEPEKRYLFYGDPVAERLLEPLVVAPDRRFAAKQLADGRLLASDLSASGDPEEGRERWRAAVRRNVADLLPHLEFVALPLLVGGVYDVTPDHQAIVGPVADGLLVAAGFSGHGFMMAPEIGRGVAAILLGDDPGGEIAKLAPDRFERGALLPETQVV
jgi:sarcosine oxidase subunit beta